MGEAAGDDDQSTWNRYVRWVFLDVNRGVLAAGTFLGVILLTRGLIWFDVLTVGGSSLTGTAFGSGAVAGLFTMVTVVLSINQLILSRVFGSPRGLREEFQGTRDLRQTVADITCRNAIPNGPTQFLALVGDGLMEQTTRLGDDYDPEVQSALDEYASSVVAYGERIAAVRESDQATDVLTNMLGARYAALISETERLQRAYENELGDDAETLDNLLQLLEATSITRQYFKTLTIQQNLAKVSRQVAITGFLALLTAFYMGFIYRTGSSIPEVDPALLPWVVSVALAIVLSPLIVLLVHIFRISTIMWYTVSVGPFVRPEQ